jgi:hypothetical protein
LDDDSPLSPTNMAHIAEGERPVQGAYAWIF